MSDASLLSFGCVVTFIAVAGVYVYAREAFTQRAQPAKVRRTQRTAKSRLRDVA